MTVRRHLTAAVLGTGAMLAWAGGAQAAVTTPRALTLGPGWQQREVNAAPGNPQQAPPEETAPEGTAPTPAPTLPTPGNTPAPESWRSVGIPSVFESRAVDRLYPGEVRRYRLSFRGPLAPPGFRWRLVFEEVRRAAKVYLNGRLLGGNRDPYTPFTLDARGLRSGQPNELVVIVDSRKDPDLPEGWWNWGGIVRPVHLVPVGPSYIDGLGTLSRVSCKGQGTNCQASLLLDGVLERTGGPRLQPEVTVRLRSPQGRVTERKFKLPKQRARRRHMRLSAKVPAPELWSPDRPALYRARITLRDQGRVTQVVNRQVGLRSVQVKGGLLYLNNRRIQLRGASIHEDMPGHGAALTDGDMNRIVSDLKAVHANVTRCHYLLSERLLSKLDRAGIMVWQQSPIWQRDHRANILKHRSQQQRALLTVRRTVKAARSHPAVITHSVANELSFRPDAKPSTRRFLTQAAQIARRFDPTLPISVDIKGKAGFPEQTTYRSFDMIGINEYYGWYGWVPDFDDLGPYLAEMHDLYPGRALVVTEFGAEALPEMVNAPGDQMGSWAFQASYTQRTLDTIGTLPWISGAIYWTLREFEVYPGWTGGAPKRPGPERNTRHHKGLLTYDGQPKPAWFIARDNFARTPLYVAPPPPPAPPAPPATRKRGARG